MSQWSIGDINDKRNDLDDLREVVHSKLQMVSTTSGKGSTVRFRRSRLLETTRPKRNMSKDEYELWRGYRYLRQAGKEHIRYATILTTHGDKSASWTDNNTTCNSNSTMSGKEPQWSLNDIDDIRQEKPEWVARMRTSPKVRTPKTISTMLVTKEMKGQLDKTWQELGNGWKVGAYWLSDTGRGAWFWISYPSLPNACRLFIKFIHPNLTVVLYLL